MPEVNKKNIIRIAALTNAMSDRFDPHRVVGAFCNVVGFSALLASSDAGNKKAVLTPAEAFQLAEEFTGIPHSHQLFQGYNSNWSKPKLVTYQSTVRALKAIAEHGLDAEFSLEGKDDGQKRR